MNALTLGLGATGGATAAGGSTSASPNRDSSGAPEGGFDKLLRGASPKPETGKGSNTPQPKAEDAASASSRMADSEVEGETEAGANDSTTAKPRQAATDTGNADEAPWPPPGLALPLMTEAQPASVASTPPTPTAMAEAPPAPITVAASSTPAVTTQTANLPNTPSIMEQAVLTPATTERALPPAATGQPALPSLAAATAEAAQPADTTTDLPAALRQALRADAGNAGSSLDAPPAQLFSQLLQPQAVAESRLSPSPFVGELAAPVDAQAADFDEAIGTRVSWLAGQKIGQAHIRVTPHELGPVEVKLHLDGDKVHASFTSANAEVRQALESSLHRLRDMLGEQGLQLAQADVGQQQSGTRNGEPDGREGPASTGGNGPADDTTPATAARLHARGLLDAYA